MVFPEGGSLGGDHGPKAFHPATNGIQLALNENEIGLLVDFLVGQVVVEEQFTLGEIGVSGELTCIGGLLFTPFRSEGKLAGGEAANPTDFLTDRYHQPSAEAGDEFPTLKVLVEKARLFQNLGGMFLALRNLERAKRSTGE